ncbi:MAG TPA: hypothetical protein VN493_03505 [Thermoanaerobaculia bacterium]|nr:hypothetical protein [Thermoanaerobaculia bacterium]
MRHVLQQSLNTITTGYTVFEDDQVLTAGQLNGLAGYLDDEVRLTRVRLLGVGIVCGLRVSFSKGTVQLTQGVGITTDGDLMHIEADTRFRGFKLYGETAPDYPPFFVDGTRIPAYELVRIGNDNPDPLAVSLGLFTDQTGRDLGEMVAVLLVESYEKDDDLCSGTDCDNLGKEAVNSIRLILIDRADAGRFVEDISTPGRVARDLGVITVERPEIHFAGSPDVLLSVYRESCRKINDDLVKVLSPAWDSPFLAGLLPQPGKTWLDKLRRIEPAFSVRERGFQYYYDFLKDLAETFNAFRDLLFEINSVCCPGVGAFSKHLLLGGLENAEPRTGFYPSPLVGCTDGQREHARFLGWKLAALIDNFSLPSNAKQAIRITPSFLEDRSLEERAIPFYYEAAPLLNSWSYALERRGMSEYCYSYHAESYEAKGGAASPLTTQNGRFSFFRIEGHLGANVTEAKSFLEDEIRKHNLPVCVRAVLLGSDRKSVLKPPRKRYTDLHRFHQILRQDLFYQLDDAVKFGASFKQEVFRAVDAGLVNDSSAGSDAPSVKAVADQSNNTLSTKASQAREKLNLPYAEYVKDSTWKTDVKDTLKASGEFKSNLGKIVKTEFQTPFDTLIGSSHVNWLNWTDQIILDQGDKDLDKLLFARFLEDHPGLEHFAGVARGGTFVLVYDDGGTVVADFMLPYFCCETGDEVAAETPLPKPDVRPVWVRDNGISILPSREAVINTKLNDFRLEIEPKIKEQVDVQKEYFQVFRESVSMIDNVYNNVGRTSTEGRPHFVDSFLDLLMQETDLGNRKVDYLRNRAIEPDVPQEKRAVYEEQLKRAEMELAKSIEDSVRYVSTSGLEVRTGSEGFRAMTEVSGSLMKLTNKEAVTAAKTRLTQVGETAKPELKLMIGGILSRKGT